MFIGRSISDSSKKSTSGETQLKDGYKQPERYEITCQG